MARIHLKRWQLVCNGLPHLPQFVNDGDLLLRDGLYLNQPGAGCQVAALTVSPEHRPVPGQLSTSAENQQTNSHRTLPPTTS